MVSHKLLGEGSKRFHAAETHALDSAVVYKHINCLVRVIDFHTDRSKAVLLLWFLTVTFSCCPYLYFGSPIMWVTYLGSWMTTCLGESCSFGLPRGSFVNCCQFMYLVISLLVLRVGYGIWLYQFLIIAYIFTFLLISASKQRINKLRVIAEMKQDDYSTARRTCWNNRSNS